MSRPGRGARRTRYYREALDAAKAAAAADSTRARSHPAIAVAQGRAALNAGTQERIRRSRAVRCHADRVLAIDSTLAPAHHVRGRWHGEAADLGVFKRTIVRTVYGGLPDASFGEATKNFKRALDFEDEIHHHLELGKTYLELDRPEAARVELQKVVDVSSPDPFAPDYKSEARALLNDLG